MIWTVSLFVCMDHLYTISKSDFTNTTLLNYLLKLYTCIKYAGQATGPNWWVSFLNINMDTVGTMKG